MPGYLAMTAETIGIPWLIAIAQPNRSAAANINLNTNGITTLFLQYWHISHKYPYTVSLRPYFPPYIFAQGTPASILATNAIQSIIYLNNAPYALSITILTAIRSIANPAGIIPPHPRAAKAINHALAKHYPPHLHDTLRECIQAIDADGFLRYRPNIDPLAVRRPVPLQPKPKSKSGNHHGYQHPIKGLDQSIR
jgi:hypothetical protein